MANFDAETIALIKLLAGNGGGGGGASSMAELSDVDFTSLADGDSIYYDEVAEKWKNGKPSLYPEFSDTLDAGSTSITFTESAITEDSKIIVFTDPNIWYVSITVSDGSAVITFDEQADDVDVSIEVH